MLSITIKSIDAKRMYAAGATKGRADASSFDTAFVSATKIELAISVPCNLRRSNRSGYFVLEFEQREDIVHRYLRAVKIIPAPVPDAVILTHTEAWVQRTPVTEYRSADRKVKAKVARNLAGTPRYEITISGPTVDDVVQLNNTLFEDTLKAGARR
jgi:hypothetical protein